MSAFLGNQVTIGTTATPVPIPQGSYNLALAAIGGTVFVGPKGVATTNGLPIIAGAQPVVIPVAAGSSPGLYAVAASAATLAWMEAA